MLPDPSTGGQHYRQNNCNNSAMEENGVEQSDEDSQLLTPANNKKTAGKMNKIIPPSENPVTTEGLHFHTTTQSNLTTVQFQSTILKSR